MTEPVLRPLPEETDRFFWGSRLLRIVGADGESRLEEVPLTRDDILDPHEGDMTMEGPVHNQVVQLLADMIDRWFHGQDVAVFAYVKIVWGIDGLSDPAPDISVIRGVPDKLADRENFSVLKEGVRPCLLIEVISPRYAEIDRQDKLRIYERAGVPEYLIIDITTTPVRIEAYCMSPAGTYLSCPPGRFESHTTGLSFAPGSERLEIIVEDVATGERLLTSLEEAAARRAAEGRLTEAAAHRAVKGRLTEEAARRAAEGRFAEEHAARRAAEGRFAEEHAARRAAERRTAEAEAAREELEAEIRRLRKLVGESATEPTDP